MTDKKTVLIVSYSFPPANSPAAKRAYYFAKYLPENNYECYVLTAKNQISSLGYGSSLDLANINFIVQPDNKLNALTTSKQIVKSRFLARIIQHLLIPDRGIVWLFEGFKNGYAFLKNNKEVKIIFATAPSFVNVLLGLLFKLFFKTKLVIDFRDFYFTKGLFKRIYPLRFFDFLLEYCLMKFADQIIFISKGMLETYQSSYPSIKSKSHLIYNGIDSLPIVKNDNAKVDVNAKLKFFYAGSFYFNSAHPRDIFVLLEVLLQLFNQNKIPFFEVHIASNLTEEERAKFQNGPYAAHIILLGLLGQSEVDAYFQNVNCCLLILGNSQQDKSAIPIKVFEYFVSQLPILALVPQQAEIVALGGYYSGFGACYYDQDLKQNMQNVLAWLEKCNKIDSCELKQDKWSDFNRKSNTEQLVKVFQL